MTALFAAILGGLGAGCRFVVDGEITSRARRDVPLATLAINVLGSFLLGLLVASGAGAGTVTILGAGFLGGFTTFSTASVEVVLLVRGRRALLGVGLAAVMLLLAVAGALAGAAIGRLL